LIFLDTGFLYALIDADDVNHVRVREVLEHERGRRLFEAVTTTNHVLAEALTLLRTRGKQDLRAACSSGRGRAAAVCRRLRTPPPGERG
jgi:predicted nucleic acid-binding protein